MVRFVLISVVLFALAAARIPVVSPKAPMKTPPKPPVTTAIPIPKRPVPSPKPAPSPKAKPSPKPKPFVLPKRCAVRTQKCCWSYSRCGVEATRVKITSPCPFKQCTGRRVCKPKCHYRTKYGAAGKQIANATLVCNVQCSDTCKTVNATCTKFAVYHAPKFCAARTCQNFVDPGAAKPKAIVGPKKTFFKHTEPVRNVTM